MLRAWFILIISLGVLSSGLSNCSRGMSQAPDGFAQVSSDDQSGLSRGRNPDSSSGEDEESGEGLMLKRQWDGHFYADTQINGTSVRMLVDTGASGIALTRDDARRAGIGISIGMPNIVGEGAGGAIKGEYVTLNRVSLGSESAETMQAVVLDGGGQSLLGQSFLSKFASVEIHGDTMVLR
jgi:aspartyl protease family protein